jgi:putative tryptophan/tyrosine transport system substrate-binding protein
MGMKHDATGRRKTFCFALCALLVALGLSAEAQQPKKVPRVGLLIASSPSPASPRIEAFLQGLRELDYVEGKDIAIEYRYAEGNPDRLPALAAELVSLKIDIIVTGGSSPTRAGKEATVTIPIVMTQDIDPVGSGFVASLARPGGNITGLSNFAPELSGKRIELLKEIVPKISRVAVPGALSLPANAQALKEVKAAAEALRVKLQHLDIQNPTDIESAFRAASKGRAEAALALPGAVLISHRTQIAGFAAKNRLPTIY